LLLRGLLPLCADKGNMLITCEDSMRDWAAIGCGLLEYVNGLVVVA
jgi:hypothetical protein